MRPAQPLGFVSMLDRIRSSFTRSALGVALVIWTFGYALVDIISFALGQTALWSIFLVSLPALVLGIVQTQSLDSLRRALLPRAFAVRAILMILAIGAATALQTLFDIYWTRWVALNFLPDWQEWALSVAPQRLFSVGSIYLWTFGLALALMWAARLTGAGEKTAARAATAEAAAAKAVAAALRLQLNPHFLFNTLNSISCLVTLDRKQEAEHMIDRLSDFLRASLNSDPMEDVPLEQEIEMIEAYLDIECARFGERLSIDVELGRDLQAAKVPNFILQPLVENAIKHGVSALKGEASVRIGAAREGEELVLTVENSSPDAAGPEAESSRPRTSTGIGLANSRQRLENRYGPRGRLETARLPGGYRAVIRLPLAS